MKIAILIVLLAAAACPISLREMGPNERLVQGTWRAAGDLGSGEDKSHSWFLEWKFENGVFEQSGYPPLKQKGKYEVEKDSDDLLRLRLYEQDGTFGKDERVIEIKIDREQGTLTIDRTAGFTRLEP